MISYTLINSYSQASNTVPKGPLVYLGELKEEKKGWGCIVAKSFLSFDIMKIV